MVLDLDKGKGREMELEDEADLIDELEMEEEEDDEREFVEDSEGESVGDLEDYSGSEVSAILIISLRSCQIWGMVHVVVGTLGAIGVETPADKHAESASDGTAEDFPLICHPFRPLSGLTVSSDHIPMP